MDNKTKVKSIIGTATGSAIGAALIPIPVADAVMITGIQVVMLGSISAVYGKVIHKDTIKGLLLTSGTMFAGVAAASGLKAIPGIGTVLGMAIGSSVAGSMTLILGVAFDALCKSGKPITAENLRAERKNAKTEAAQMAEEFKQKSKKTNEVKGAISFKAIPENFASKVEFFFDSSMFSGSKAIRVTELNGGEVIWQMKVLNEDRPIVWESKSIPNGTYIAYLDIEGLIPIPLKLTK